MKTHPMAKPYFYQEFDASGTWVHPYPGREIEVWLILVGGGAGGCGGYYSGSTKAGAGGGGGGILEKFLRVKESVSVTIGAGGTGGYANSYNPTAGGVSSFGNYASSPGGIAPKFADPNTGGGDPLDSRLFVNGIFSHYHSRYFYGGTAGGGGNYGASSYYLSGTRPGLFYTGELIGVSGTGGGTNGSYQTGGGGGAASYGYGGNGYPKTSAGNGYNGYRGGGGGGGSAGNGYALTYGGNGGNGFCMVIWGLE